MLLPALITYSLEQFFTGREEPMILIVDVTFSTEEDVNAKKKVSNQL